MIDSRRRSAFALAAIASACPLAFSQTEVLIPCAADNTLYEDLAGSVSNGAGTGFFSGRPFAGWIQRGALLFDVAGSVPAGMRITQASVELYMDRTLAGAVNIDLVRFSASWGEGTSVGTSGGGGGDLATTNDVTWLHRFYPSTLWTNPGGDFSTTVSASKSVAGVGPYTWSSATLVADVQDMLDLPAQNYGWMVRGDESAGGTAKRFVSRESGSVGRRPMLRASYLPAATTSTQGTGCGYGPLQLAANGAPTLGNLGFALNTTGGTANAPVALYAALGFFPGGISYSPSCKLELDPSVLFLLLNAGLDATGTLSLPIPIANDPSLAGAAIALQSFALEIGFEAQVVSSNGLRVVPGA